MSNNLNEEKHDEGMQVLTPQTAMREVHARRMKFGFYVFSVLFLVTFVLLIVVLATKPKTPTNDVAALLDDIPVIDQTIDEEVPELFTFFSDYFLSFEVPSNVYVTLEDRSSSPTVREVKFWTAQDAGYLTPVGLTLTYPKPLVETEDGGDTIEAIEKYYETQDGATVTVFEVDGRSGVQVLSEDTFTIYLPMDDAAGSEAFVLSGPASFSDLITMVLSAFVETADLHI